MSEVDLGASASGPGSREPSPDGLGPSGFDPSRVVGCVTAEDIDLLGKLADWYESGPAFEFAEGRLRIARAVRAALAALAQPPKPDPAPDLYRVLAAIVEELESGDDFSARQIAQHLKAHPVHGRFL